MPILKIAALYTLLFLLAGRPAAAQQSAFTITPLLEHESIGKYLEILEDKNENLSISDVSSFNYNIQFLPVNQGEPGLGFTSSVYWAKLLVNNPSGKPVDWYLEIAYPLLDYIDLYVPDTAGNFLVKKSGDHLPFASRDVHHRNFIFLLTESPDNQNTYYLRFKTSSSLNMPLHFWRQGAFFDRTTSEQILLGIFFGATVIMIIYNIFLFFGFKDLSYIYYVIFLIAWGLSQLAINGLAFQYLWPENIWWANASLPFFMFIAISATVKFCRILLDLNMAAPMWDRIMAYFSYFLLASAAFSLITDYSISIKAGAAASILDVLILTIVGSIRIKQGSRPAKFFIAAWGFFMIGVVLFALKSFGLLEGNFITNWGIQIGAFALMVLFSMAVQDRVKLEKRDKYLAQKAFLENAHKRVETLQESERLLEDKVNERTKELFEKNVSLKKSTEDLQESAQELDTLDNIVKIINREIEFGNLIKALLEQGLKLVNQANNAAALIYNIDTEKFQFVASSGHDLAIFKNQSMTINEIRKSFAELSEEVVKGIYLIRNNEVSNKNIVFKATDSKSILAMSISLDGQLAGFLLFDNSDNPGAFDHSDAQKLKRFRSHATSAFAKVRLLQQMKKINDEIVRAQGQLIVQEKMASLGQLTAGIAHEIKNPLNFVNNFAEGTVELTEELSEELDKQKGRLDSKDFDELMELVKDIKQNALDIRDNGQRADSIVRSMMDHARGSKGELRFVDLNQLLEENVNLAYHGYRALDASFNIQIEKKYSKSLPKVEIVQTDVGRVLLNILNNACYALLEKQKAKDNNYSAQLKVSTKSVPGGVEIHIFDNGMGIPEKVRNKIFNPFFTTKPTGSGNTGLGLSISYDIIVQQHNGKIKVESVEEEYCEFIITLPKTRNA